MAVTLLAVVFLLLVIAIALAGLKMFGKGKGEGTGRETQKCSLCLRTLEKSSLIERQVGDYRMLHFCRECVLSLYSDLGLKS